MCVLTDIVHQSNPLFHQRPALWNHFSSQNHCHVFPTISSFIPRALWCRVLYYYLWDFFQATDTLSSSFNTGILLSLTRKSLHIQEVTNTSTAESRKSRAPASARSPLTASTIYCDKKRNVSYAWEVQLVSLNGHDFSIKRFCSTTGLHQRPNPAAKADLSLGIPHPSLQSAPPLKVTPDLTSGWPSSPERCRIGGRGWEGGQGSHC